MFSFFLKFNILAKWFLTKSIIRMKGKTLSFIILAFHFLQIQCINIRKLKFSTKNEKIHMSLNGKNLGMNTTLWNPYKTQVFVYFKDVDNRQSKGYQIELKEKNDFITKHTATPIVLIGGDELGDNDLNSYDKITSIDYTGAAGS